MDYIVVELCDACHVRALEQFDKESMTLTFCKHHAQQHGPALSQQGWTQKSLESVDIPVPALV
jgi:hypothetical protein